MASGLTEFGVVPGLWKWSSLMEAVPHNRFYELCYFTKFRDKVNYFSSGDFLVPNRYSEMLEAIT
jgi:hypothetical protein